MNNFVSNFILGFFVLVLMAVYGFAKQPPVYSLQMKQGTVANDQTTQTPVSGGLKKVKLPNGVEIMAWVPKGETEQQKGLAAVDNLEPDQGMLFELADDASGGIWMKDMKFPIDIVWLDADGQVVHLVENAPVPTEGEQLPVYESEHKASYILEVKAGQASAWGVKEGDKLDILNS